MESKKWLERYIKENQPVTPKKVFEAGAAVGLSRKEIKKARSWHGKYIDTQTRDSETLWRWNP